jgi:hypothetical protein
MVLGFTVCLLNLVERNCLRDGDFEFAAGDFVGELVEA